MVSHIFVVALDDLNSAVLHRLPGASQLRFHPLLTLDFLTSNQHSIADMLATAQQELDAFDEPIDAIVGFWDFPVSMMVPILCERYGLRSATLRSVVACEHKYWSRLKQQQIISEIPAFGLLDVTSSAPRLPGDLDFPVWIKPVKSVSSEGAFLVSDAEMLKESLPLLRDANERIVGPFEEILAMLELPPDVAAAGGGACLVEEPVEGRQATAEGFVQHSEPAVYGVVDSVSYPGVSSFLRYQYPSTLPEAVRDQIADLSKRVVTAMGLNDTTFNIEYFWDPATDLLRLLEINVRHSQSHALLFEMVDGVANHAYMVEVALGREPPRLHGRGRNAVAAKWFIRHFGDGIVRRVPTAAEVSALERELPGTTITIEVRTGDRLSLSIAQDSYSCVLAQVFTGGSTEASLQQTWDACVAGLPFEIDAVADDSP